VARKPPAPIGNRQLEVKVTEQLERIRQALSSKCAELERKQNLLASSPPGSTFGEVLDLEHAIAALRSEETKLVTDKYK